MRQLTSSRHASSNIGATGKLCPYDVKEDQLVRSRPQVVTVAAILMALFSLMNFPGPWWYAVPGAEETPMFVIYSGIVLAIVGILAAVGLWMLKTWGLWLTVVVSAVNILFNVSGLFMAPSAALKAAIAVQ